MTHTPPVKLATITLSPEYLHELMKHQVEPLIPGSTTPYGGSRIRTTIDVDFITENGDTSALIQVFVAPRKRSRSPGQPDDDGMRIEPMTQEEIDELMASSALLEEQ